MKDLDMSDVLADADRMKDEYYEQIFNYLVVLSDNELSQEIYRLGISARAGREFDMDCYQMAQEIHLVNIGAICEGCGNQGGCDMCCPPDFTDYGIDQDAHFARFGRPALPNEY